uniref:VP n=1 Tax=Phylloscopus inornatus densovirus TaxID=2794547 RepID=A0A8A4XDZ9_9VIRU|nr:MAG: VP [Phylloscopus inornatus densovirus]
MLKRAAEGPAEGEPTQKAPGVAGNSGARAETVDNPIPRLFKTQTLTFHFTQRTWEEVGPGEMLYLPTCTSPCYMFDNSHLNILKKYLPQCSTFQFHGINAKISNILMLQDEIKTESGTPKDVTAYTQACYLLHYNPTRTHNWFKLGCSTDCGETQKYLTLDMSHKLECNLISQMKKLNNYTNFEQLTINPAKPYFAGGWNGGKATLIGLETEGDENFGSGKYKVQENYFSPEVNQPLREFSCNYHGLDPHIPLNTHPSMVRNLDKWTLHKYGDSFDININTNVDNLNLINVPSNHIMPDYQTIHNTIAPLQPKDKMMAYSIFVYPSRNRPYFTRKDNLSFISPVESKNNNGHLSHHFITMPPIKKNDGSLIKQRASFLLEQSCSMTMQFPEYTSDPDSIANMIGQSNGVVLRSGLFDIQPEVEKQKTPVEPPTKEIWDPQRDADREKYLGIFKKKYTPKDWNDQSGESIVGQVRSTVSRVITDANSFVSFCKQIGSVCPVIDFTKIPPGGYAPYDHIWKYKVSTPKQTDKIQHNMMLMKYEKRPQEYFMYLLYEFIKFLRENYISDPVDTKYIKYHFPDMRGIKSWAAADTLSELFIQWTKPTLEGPMNDVCIEEWVEINNIYEIESTAYMWDYNEQEDWGKSRSFRGAIQALKVPVAPIRFPIERWVQFLNKINIELAPPQPAVNKYVEKYNRCIEDQIDEKLPRRKIKVPIFAENELAPTIITPDTVTNLFYV